MDWQRGIRLGASDRILAVGGDAGRKLHPGVAAAVVDGILRRREVGVGEAADRHRHIAVLDADLGVEQVGAADRAEAEPVLGAGVAGAQIFGGLAGNGVGQVEGRQRRKDAAGPPLALEAMADTHPCRITFDGDRELAAGTGRRTWHGGLPCGGVFNTTASWNSGLHHMTWRHRGSI